MAFSADCWGEAESRRPTARIMLVELTLEVVVIRTSAE